MIKLKKDPSRRRRTIAKAMTWRALSTLVTGSLAIYFFGNWKVCGVLIACDCTLKFFLYYYHERFWHQISWGKRNV